MAIFGFQLCFTLIMACFLQKLMPVYSFGRWLLCNGSLMRYKHPSDEELRKLAGKPHEKSNGKARNRRNNNKVQNDDTKTFKVPKSLDITLDAAPISRIDSLVLRNYADYEWLVDYTLFGIFVYIATETYYEVWQPTKEFNISMIWIAFSMWFAIKNMLSVLWLYAKSKAGGEISMSIAFGMFSFVTALGVLIVKEDILEFGIDAYTSQNATVNNNELPSYRKPFTMSGIKLMLAAGSFFIGMLFTFPAIRMAQMYVDALKYSESNRLWHLILHINFFAPVLVALMWVKPVIRDLIRDPHFGLSDESSPLLTDSQFEIGRIIFIICICILRLALMRTHLQAYLNVAYEKMLKLKKESGLITNTDLQLVVTQVFYYLGVVAVQYLSPLVMLLCSTLCLKTLGGYSWLAVQESYVDNINNTNTSAIPPITPFFGDATLQEMVHSVGGNLYNLRAVFTPLLLRGVLSYVVWWSAANWFVASCLGYLYHTYLAS